VTNDHGTELAFLRHDLAKALVEVGRLRVKAHEVVGPESTVYHGLSQATAQLEGAAAGLEELL
jgi:hypothetical protein